MCDWFRVEAAFVKFRASAVSTGWDDETQNPLLHRMLAEIISRASQADPSRSDWCMNGQDVTMWVDASSLATGCH